VRLGGYVMLARILDKGRAELAGTAGEYKFNNPMDQHFFRFTGITAEALKNELATGKGDGEFWRGLRRPLRTSARRGRSSSGALTRPSVGRMAMWKRWSSLPNASAI